MGVALNQGPWRFQTDLPKTWQEAREVACCYGYDLVLLVSTLPDIDDCEAARRTRTAPTAIPVLILSSSNRPLIQAKALGFGAEDSIDMPLDVTNLVARIQEIGHRSNDVGQPSVKVGPLTLHQDSHEVLVNGRTLNLTSKEYAILEILALRKGRLVTKKAVLNHVYDGAHKPRIKIIDVLICKLRRKLAQCRASNLIVTVWGRGYTIRDMDD